MPQFAMDYKQQQQQQKEQEQQRNIRFRNDEYNVTLYCEPWNQLQSYLHFKHYIWFIKYFVILLMWFLFVCCCCGCFVCVCVCNKEIEIFIYRNKNMFVIK